MLLLLVLLLSFTNSNLCSKSDTIAHAGFCLAIRQRPAGLKGVVDVIDSVWHSNNDTSEPDLGFL